MLAAFRAFSKSWVAVAIILLIVAAFAVVGMQDVFRAVPSNVVIKADSRTITQDDYKRTFDNVRQQAQQSGQTLTPDLAVEQGFDRRILDGLANAEAFAAYLGRQGIRPGEAVATDALRQTPAFFNQVTGAFDKDRFAQLLGQQGLTPARYIGFLKDDAAERHYAAALTRALQPPRIYGALVAAYGLESRTVTGFVLGPGAVPPPAQPTDAQLAAFIRENAAQLRRPEVRVLTIARFSAAALAQTLTPDPAELQRQFEFRKDTLSTPERRTVVQLPAKDQAQAQQLAARLNAGEQPDAVAKAAGVQPVRFDNQPQTAIPDRRVAQQAFSLAANAVSGPIQGELGWAVVKVLAITPGQTATLNSVRPQLEQEARQRQAEHRVYEQVQKYEEAHGAGASVVDAARQVGGSPAAFGPVTAEGQLLNGGPSGLDPAMLKAAFDLPQEGESDLITLKPGEYAVLRVDSITPAAVPPLAEIRPQLVQAWQARDLVRRLTERADSLAERARKGEALPAVAASAGASVFTLVGLDRTNAPDRAREWGDQAVARLLAAKPNEVITVNSPRGVLVGRVDSVRPGDPAAVAAQAAQFGQQAGQVVVRELSEVTRTYARAQVKPRVFLDRARQAIGASAPAGEAAAGDAPAGKAPAGKGAAKS